MYASPSTSQGPPRSQYSPPPSLQTKGVFPSSIADPGVCAVVFPYLTGGCRYLQDLVLDAARLGFHSECATTPAAARVRRRVHDRPKQAHRTAYGYILLVVVCTLNRHHPLAANTDMSIAHSGNA